MTEVWERFGFYTVSSLLILYLTKSFAFPDAQAYAIFAAFSAMLYVVPTLGGYIADNYLGYQRTLMIGTYILFLGYLVLALAGKQWFYLSLALIVVGSGFFKSMPYSILSCLYKNRQGQIDGAFTIYYLSINAGGILPLLLGGLIARAYGWKLAFFIAAIGMLIGVITFAYFHKKKLKDIDTIHKTISWYGKCIFIIAILAATVICMNLIKDTKLTYHLVEFLSIGLIVYVILSFRNLNNKERGNVVAVFLLTICGIIFFALYNQGPMSLTLFIDRNVNHHILGFNLPSSSFWIFNPIWILIIGPCLGFVYGKLANNNADISIPTKFGIGILLMGIGYLVIVIGSYLTNNNALVSPWWIVLSYAFQSAAELLVSALGTAMIAKLAPKRMLSLMMGVWFFGTAIGGLLSGYFAKWTEIKNIHMEKIAVMHTYDHAFLLFALISLSIGMIMTFICAPLINRVSTCAYYKEPVEIRSDVAIATSDY
jgi:POT family proton-dependent oligopeptide transporter